jgi:C-1 hydroxylase
MERRLMLARAGDALAAWNRGDAEGTVAGVAEDVIWRDVVLGVLNGRDALREAVQAYMAAFPDLRVEATSSTVAGPRLAQEFTVTGTHRGELLGVPATGRWTENYAAAIVIFDDDGLLIEGTTYWNALSMMCQLGVATGFAPAVTPA